MAEASTLHDAFIDELRDTYDAEKQLTKALAKLAKAASHPKLRQAFESHLEETRGQIERLEQVFESLDEKVRGKHCDGIAGIIEEGKSIMEEDFDETTMDACLIAAGQRAEHYEMAATARWSRGRRRWVTPRPSSSCSRHWMKRRRPTRSCPDWPRAASIKVRRTRRIPRKATEKRWRQARALAAGVLLRRERADARGESGRARHGVDQLLLPTPEQPALTP